MFFFYSLTFLLLWNINNIKLTILTVFNCTVNGIKYIRIVMQPCGFFFLTLAASMGPGLEAEST